MIPVVTLGDQVCCCFFHCHPTIYSFFVPEMPTFAALNCFVFLIQNIYTPYNRLLRRQITASTTDQSKFCGKRVGEVFLFAKINKLICGLQLIMQNIFNVWRYCSSNLTLFHVQISILSAHQILRFNKIA